MSDAEWLTAPTHDGLWWVWDGAATELREFQYGHAAKGVATWWMKTMEHGDDGDYRVLPSHWRFTPAIPPAPPVTP